MPLRIGFDLDGVLADMEAELDRRAETLFGEQLVRRLSDTSDPNSESIPLTATPPDGGASIAAGTDGSAPIEGDQPPANREYRLTPRQQSQLWKHIGTIERFWESLQEIEPGIVARLAALATDRRWEIIFLTRRPECRGATAQVQSQRWLESKGFQLPSVYVVQGSRGRIAAALDLDFVIDDRPENCLDVVVDSKARAILVWRGEQLPAAARRLGIGVVKTVAECLDILTEIDSEPPSRPGFVDRVMRLLGLKTEPANA